MDALDRKMSDQGQFLGMGVLGKASERSRIRNLMSERKIAEQEFEKSASAQTSYASVLEAQRSSLLQEANVLDEQSPLGTGGFLQRAQAEGVSPIQIQNRDDLALAIKEIENIKLVGEKEIERVRTLNNLKKIQQEIISGKTKEEEIARRINDEDKRTARRSTSFAYGVSAGFDKLKDEKPEMFRMFQDWGLIPNDYN